MTSISRLLLAATLAAVPAMLPATEPRRGQFTGMAHVADDGRIRVESLGGVAGTLADAVRAQLEARRAIPAMRDGHAVATVAPVSGAVVLTPDGEHYAVALDDVGLQPAPARRTPLSYPVESMREERAGWVELDFALDADGAPVDVRVVHASHPSFAKATTRAFAAWRFATAGAEPGRRYRFAASFETDSTKPTPAFACTVDAAYARLEGQPGCVDEVSVHGSRVRR